MRCDIPTREAVFAAAASEEKPQPGLASQVLEAVERAIGHRAELGLQHDYGYGVSVNVSFPLSSVAGTGRKELSHRLTVRVSFKGPFFAYRGYAAEVFDFLREDGSGHPVRGWAYRPPESLPAMIGEAISKIDAALESIGLTRVPDEMLDLEVPGMHSKLYVGDEMPLTVFGTLFTEV